MFLKALEIQGFKSFPDRTRITVGKGITAVVGPNGSGKSNISDAIRWVLGETSAKQLRGGGKMENVIFGGTQQRGAMGFASVSLVVDNTDRRIDVDNDEVTIGRKYYRSGDSEYSVNGQNVRLKDIYELFLDTGLGRDGYSVIGQGRIAEIVGAKSNERREIFEEASGIAKYRYRKNEAERRLASAEENLVRLRDILGELEERVGPLERESKKAKQYLELAERRKGLEVTLWVDTVQKARDTVREQQRKIEIAGADYARAGREIEAIDAETESTRAEIEHLITEADRCNAEIRAITEEIAGADSRIAVLENDIAHNDATIASLKEEIGQSGLGREAIAAENGCTVKCTDDVKDACTGADVIYTDVWVSMGEPDEVWAERIKHLEKFRVTKEVMAMANEGAIFLHCLPAFHDTNTTIGADIAERFGVTEMEVEDEVFESKASKVFDEAENRMHTIKAVMYATLCG